MEKEWLEFPQKSIFVTYTFIVIPLFLYVYIPILFCIIAMGAPSEGNEGLFRNPMEEVQRFFELRHEGKF